MDDINDLMGSPITILICTFIILALALLQNQLPPTSSLILGQGISAIEILLVGVGIVDIVNILIFLIHLVSPNESGRAGGL